MKRMQLLSVALFGVMSSVSFASGYVCSGGEINVKVFNHVNPELGTRIPAVMIVSHDLYGTLAVGKGNQISKARVGDAVEFAISNPSTSGIDEVILTVEHLEGRGGLENGAVVDGTLELISGEGTTLIGVTCERYKKTNE